MNKFFTFLAIGLLFSSCKSEEEQEKKIKIENLSYSVSVSGMDGDDGGPIVYDTCTLVSIQGSVVLIDIETKNEVILSDHCRGGEYSNNVVIYDATIIDVIYGNAQRGKIKLYGFSGTVDRSRIGNTFLASVRKHKDKYFVWDSIQASINGEIENNAPRNVIIDLPNSYAELVRTVQETAMNLNECENILPLSDEEYDKFVAGDPERCVREEDEEEGPDWEAICAAEDAPECCFNDLIECEE